MDSRLRGNGAAFNGGKEPFRSTTYERLWRPLPLAQEDSRSLVRLLRARNRLLLSALLRSGDRSYQSSCRKVAF